MIKRAAATLAVAMGLTVGSFAGAPPALEASTCGGYTGPECTVTSTDVCFNLILFKWCSKFQTTTYWPPETEDDEPVQAPEEPTISLA